MKHNLKKGILIKKFRMLLVMKKKNFNNLNKWKKNRNNQQKFSSKWEIQKILKV